MVSWNGLDDINKIDMKNSKILNINNIEIIGYVFVCSLVFLISINIPIRFDANSFITTGERVLNGDISKIYEPINGSGPFTYAPWVAFLMVPFAILGRDINLVAAFSSLSMLGILWTALKTDEVQNHCKVPALVITSAIFSFLIWESLYIGQIDIILCFLIFASYASKQTKLIKYVFAALVVMIKPQFLPVLFFRQSLKEGFLNLGVLIALCSSSVVFLYFYVSQDYQLILNLFKNFLINAHSIANTIDVTNQSGISIAKRFLGTSPYAGRYYPEFFSPSLNVSYNYIHPYPMIFLSLLMCILSVLCIKNFKSLVHSKWGYSSFFLLLPIFSPLFWFVHYIYVIPVSFYLVRLFFANGKWYLMLAFLPLLVSMPVITTNHLADIFLANGLPLVSLALLLIAYVSVGLSDK